MNPFEESVARSKLRQELEKMTPEERLEAQLDAMKAFNETTPETPESHWAAHRFINITCYRSFGRMDISCRHRSAT